MEVPTSSATVLTPPGPGAVAVIEVFLGTASHVDGAFSQFAAVPPRQLSETPVGRIVYGRWDQEDCVTVRTGEFRWEIHCHGGAAATRRILSDLNTAGVCVRTPTHPDDKLNLGAAAVIEQTLLKCRTRKTAGLALAQLDGRLDQFINDMRSSDPSIRRAAIQHKERWKKVADHLTKPWRVALIGPPNAGKSSLLNAIAGLQRSIVSSTPGTTRDLVEVDVVLDGWIFQLVDSAGVRDRGSSELEDMGIEQSLFTLRNCDLICLVVDVASVELPSALLNGAASWQVPSCILLNKCDLRSSDDHSNPLCSAEAFLSEDLKSARRFYVSALTSEGLPEFLQWMVTTLVVEAPALETVLPLPSLSF